jgi:hypothetical protein
VLAVLMQESSARPGAHSPKGAIGLMQVMPHMYEVLALPGSAAHVEANIEAGCTLLADNIRRLGEERGIAPILGQPRRQRHLPAGRAEASSRPAAYLDGVGEKFSRSDRMKRPVRQALGRGVQPLRRAGRRAHGRRGRQGRHGREAIARGRMSVWGLRCGHLRHGQEGDVLGVARIAAIRRQADFGVDRSATRSRSTLEVLLRPSVTVLDQARARTSAHRSRDGALVAVSAAALDLRHVPSRSTGACDR